ncbi:MAG: immunoglobulin domain-containing protein [Halanaerobiales bacterium]
MFINLEKAIFLLLLSCIVFIAGFSVQAETYYIDYANGDDNNTGTEEDSPWKHAPGVEEAIGGPASVELQPGDTVLFKGGVTYYGTILLSSRNSWAGTEEAPIIYKGNGWGEGRARISGGQVFGQSWTQCTSAEEVRGNPNYSNIYYTEAPEDYHIIRGTYEDGKMLWFAQDPAPEDPFHYDRTGQFRVIPHEDSTIIQTHNSITDPRHFTQEDPDYYDGAYIIVYRIPNVVDMYKVTGYDPETHTVYHEEFEESKVYTDRDSYYAIINHPAGMSFPGTYWHDTSSGRFYVWPNDSGSPLEHIYSFSDSGSTGINIDSKSYITVEGFLIEENQHGIIASGDNLVIQDNIVRNLKSAGRYAIHVGGDNILVKNNTVKDCQRAVGILMSGNNVSIIGNRVSRTSRQGIWSMGTNRGIIADNLVEEIAGTHSNAISVYLYNEDILIARNQVYDSVRALTWSGDDDPDLYVNLTIYGNVFEGSARSWGHEMHGLTAVNNTFVGGTGIMPDDTGIVMFNNIGPGGSKYEDRIHKYNIITRKGWDMKPRYGWVMDDTEIDFSEEDINTLYRDMENDDYHIFPDSVAVDAGGDPTQYLPVDLFPEFDFYKDVEGNIRPQNGLWDIGAYECIPEQLSIPIIIEQPESQIAVPGDDVTFTVTASGNPAPEFQWQYNDGDIDGEIENTLTLENVQPSDAGDYSVLVSNSEGSVTSNTATLTLLDLPEISNLDYTPEYFSVYLTWDNPDNHGEEWDSLVIVRKKDSAPTGPADGTEIFNGNTSNFYDYNLTQELEQGQDQANYHYAVYTYKEFDTDIIYSDPVTVEVNIPALYNKAYLKIEADQNQLDNGNIVIGQNTRGDLYGLWNEELNFIDRGPGDNETSLWLYSNLIGNAENQISTGSKIVSARMVFNVTGSSFINNSENSNENNNLSIGQSHTIKIYQITDPDNLGSPHYADESGVRTGLDFNYRDHRPGINIPWVNPDDNSNQSETDSGDIMSLLDGVKPIDTVEFKPEVFTDEMLDSLQFNITDAVQAWADEEVNQGLYITTGQGWENGEQLQLYGVTPDVNEQEENEAQNGNQPYIEIIYADSNETGDLTPPEPVEDIVVSPGETSLELNWVNPSEGDIDGIKILRREGIIPFGSRDDEFVTIIDDLNISTFTDTGLTTGKTYYYAIYTFDDQHNYSQKVWIKGTPGSPASAPLLENLTAGPGTANLSWTQVDEAEIYHIYREDSSENIKLLAEISQEQTAEYIDPVPEGEYTYWLTAVNQYGEGPVSNNETVVVSEGASSEPQAPTSLAGLALSGSEIELNWTDNSDNELAFVLERQDSENGEWQEIYRKSTDVITYIDENLQPDTYYNYRIKAENSAGSSAYSTEVTVATPDLPVAVSNLSWEVISASHIKVKWEDTPNEDGYKVELFKLTEDGEIGDGEAVDTQFLSADITYCYFVSLEPGKEYRVRLASIKGNESIYVKSDIIRTSSDQKGGLF